MIGTMIVLAADTSTSVNTVAVCEEGRVLAETVADVGRKHSERLLATMGWVLEEAGLALKDVDLLAVSVGPGSFTGLRVGTATWKGLALGAGIPLMGVPTLDAMSHLVFWGDAVELAGCAIGSGARGQVACPLLDARMGEVFGAVYRFDGGLRRTLKEARACPVEDLVDGLDGDVVFLGDGAELYRDRILESLGAGRFASPESSTPRASAVAAEALFRLGEGEATDAALVSPIYLRRSQAEELRAKKAELAACTASKAHPANRRSRPFNDHFETEDA